MRMRWSLARVYEVDTVKSKASIDVTLTFYWTDNRLEGLPEHQFPDDLWGPCVATDAGLANDFINDVSTIKYARNGRDKGALERSQRFAGEIFNPMCLADFPYDVDDIEFEVYTASTWRAHAARVSGGADSIHGPKTYTVRPVVDGKWISQWWDGAVSEWTFQGLETSIEEKENTHLKKNRPVTGLERTNIGLQVWLARRPGECRKRCSLLRVLSMFSSYR
eukprot:COSAG06_NODE_5907_length_3217_cov_4.295382_5_plen_221_part_00